MSEDGAQRREAKPRTRSLLTEASGRRSSSSSEEAAAAAASNGDGGRLAILRELANARRLCSRTAEENAEIKQYVETLNSECLELHDSLFQEANRQVSEARQAKDRVEKRCVELERQNEVLTGEVAALKELIEKQRRGSSPGHRRSESSTIRQPDLPDSEMQSFELDPLVYGEFLDWLNKPSLDSGQSAFMSRIVERDVRSCLDFGNRQLSEQVLQAALTNQLHIEALSSVRDSQSKPRCSLMKSKLCHYRIRLADSEPWHCISHCARNRIIATCNLLHYLRYVMQGLLPSLTSSDKFTEIQSHRRNMYLAMLGFQR